MRRGRRKRGISSSSSTDDDGSRTTTKTTTTTREDHLRLNFKFSPLALLEFLQIEIKGNDRTKPDYICAGAYDQAKWSKQCGSRYKGKEKRRGETSQRIQCGLQGCLSEVLEDLEKYRLGMSPISSSCR
uniref:Uncharacterized protein n=1 Tax=Vespula pensylvanica TaxID=30213 RepID=A0A834PF98_VESPE|nr:hypothetical protein H0235_001014 [Vespula pensylvanica]